MELAELWVLADKMVMPELRNFVVQKMIEIRQRIGLIPIGILHYIYDETAIDSPLRRLMVSEVSHHCCEGDLTDRPENFPHGLLIYIVKEQVHKRNETGGVEQKPSDFFVPIPIEAAQTAITHCKSCALPRDEQH